MLHGCTDSCFMTMGWEAALHCPPNHEYGPKSESQSAHVLLMELGVRSPHMGPRARLEPGFFPKSCVAMSAIRPCPVGPPPPPCRAAGGSCCRRSPGLPHRRSADLLREAGSEEPSHGPTSSSRARVSSQIMGGDVSDTTVPRAATAAAVQSRKRLVLPPLTAFTPAQMGSSQP